ncbi:MAG: hypothetical protein AAGA67_00695 [Cyanobacteria bacterium P01_F01_bin.153]
MTLVVEPVVDLKIEWKMSEFAYFSIIGDRRTNLARSPVNLTYLSLRRSFHIPFTYASTKW